MALTVEDLYRQYAGREADPSGLAFWKAGFGNSIDENEVASFVNAVAEARAQGTEPAATTTAVEPQAPTAPVNPTVKLYQDTLGRTPSQEEIDSWNFGSTIDARELDRFLGAARNEATSTMPTTGAAANIAKQILAQGTTSQWSGEGYGSAEKNAYDMGVLLAGQGLTDINQLGQAKVEIPVGDENGVPITETVTKFINKETGQPLNTYYDKAASISPNIFGGTFTGKDSTAYGVQFDAAGKPVFYSQYGGDSSDAASVMPLVQLALLATGAGGLLGNAILGAGAGSIATGALGNAILGGATSSLAGGDWRRGALLGGAGGALGGYLQGLDSSLIPSLDAADTAGGLIPKFGTNYDDWMKLVMDNPESQQALLNLINGTQVASTTPVTTPTTSDGLFNVPPADTVNITGAKVPTQISPDTLNAVTSLLNSNLNTATPTVKVTAENPNKTEVPVIPAITTVPTTVPNITTTPPTTTDVAKTGGTTTDTKLTTSDVIKLLGIGTTIAGINAATGGGTGGTTGGTQYPIVDIPSGWSPATATKVAPATQLPAIDFGTRNLLKGTQWEKFLDPNYGKVPAPVQFSQPSNLSYNDLMGILGSKQGYPAASGLSINDIISGIQNQYGQAPSSTMG